MTRAFDQLAIVQLENRHLPISIVGREYKVPRRVGLDLEQEAREPRAHDPGTPRLLVGALGRRVLLVRALEHLEQEYSAVLLQEPLREWLRALRDELGALGLLLGAGDEARLRDDRRPEGRERHEALE